MSLLRRAAQPLTQTVRIINPLVSEGILFYLVQPENLKCSLSAVSQNVGIADGVGVGVLVGVDINVGVEILVSVGVMLGVIVFVDVEVSVMLTVVVNVGAGVIEIQLPKSFIGCSISIKVLPLINT